MAQSSDKKAKATGTHERSAENEAKKGSSDRSFGLVFAVVFTNIGLRPLISNSNVRWWFLAIFLVFAGVPFACPIILAPLDRLWTRFGLLLNRIVSPVIMRLLFFVVFSRIALIMRGTGNYVLYLKFDRKAKNDWIGRKPPGPPLSRSRTNFEGRFEPFERILASRDETRKSLYSGEIRNEVPPKK